MRQIVNDWISFCEGVKSFENDYFYTLFMDDLVIKEIEVIYRYFPNSEKLVDRMKKYLYAEIPPINGKEKEKVLEKLIKLDFEERKSILVHLPIFSDFNSNPKFIFSRNVEEVYDLASNDIWIQGFYDFLRNQLLIEDDKTWELKSALYGKTYDFDYQLYLFQPLLKTDYSFEHLFEFKRLGGIYAITDKGVYYSFNTESPT